MFLKTMKEKKIQKRIEELGKAREEVRNSIRGIQKKMDALVQKAAKSDELDRKICSADYQTLRDQLQAEWQQFEDLSRLIGQLKNARLTRQRTDAFEKIISVNSRVDLDQLISREDSMAVRRQMMKEENEQFQEVLDQTQRRSSLSGEDEEFNRLVTRAKVENLPADEPASPEVCLSL
jgi:hypothetical protein